MTTHRHPSPEDHFNDFLDALVSGRSTPDASVGSADTNAESAMPGDAARELKTLARSADARHGGPPDSMWETIMSANPATLGNNGFSMLSMPRRNARPSTTPAPSGGSEPPSQGQVRPKRSAPGHRKPVQLLHHLRPALSAAILLAIIVGTVALQTNWPPSWNEAPPPVRLPALSGSLVPTPFGTPIADVNSCLASNGLVYRTDELSETGDLTLKRATSIDGDDEIVSTSAAITAYDSGVANIAIGIGNGVYTARNVVTGDVTTLGYTLATPLENIQFGPWVVAPDDAYGTSWTVTYLPTMEQTAASSAFPEDKLQPHTIKTKVSADGSTLALVVTPKSPDKGTGDARPVGPSVLLMTANDPTSITRIPGADPDLATHADLVAISPDGSLISIPWVLAGGGDRSVGITVIPVVSVHSDAPAALVQHSLNYPVREGFAFFSPSGTALNYAVDGTVGTVAIDEGSQPAETGTYDGALYGAVIAPGGEGALVGLRQTSAESPSRWLWIDGENGKITEIPDMRNFMFAHTPVSPEEPRVIVNQIVELTRSDYETGPGFVFFDPATGSAANELREAGADRVGGSVGTNWMNASTDGSTILLRLDDEAIIKAYRPSTGEHWSLPSPEDVSPTSLAAFPSPDGNCIALMSNVIRNEDGPPSIWIVSAQPGAEPELVATGWFANWYQAPVTTGP